MPQSISRKSFIFDRPGKYRICVDGALSEDWIQRLGNMSITTRKRKDYKRVTTLVGTVVDQAALSGVLNTLYELHLTLLSVEFLGEE